MIKSTVPKYKLFNGKYSEKMMTKAQYKETMSKLESLMLKGSENITDKEYETIRELSLQAQSYEQSHFEIEAPTTIQGMIELKMFQLKIRQKELASKLHVSETKLSLIMNGKRKPDLSFLKSVHKELDVDADFLLEHA